MVAIEPEQMALPSHLSVVNPRNHLPRQLRLNVVGASKAKLAAQGLTEGAFTLVFSIEVLYVLKFILCTRVFFRP